jgi:hypothetical protein
MSFSRSWLALALLLFACSSGPRGSVEIELAPETACGQPTDTLDATWQCMRIQVCRVTSTTPTDAGPPRDAPISADAGPPRGRCALITSPGGDHEAATDELIVDRVTLTSFDAELDTEAEYEVIVTAYDASGNPVAIGRSPAASPVGSPVRVRLHRYGTSSCAGVYETLPPGRTDVRAAHRAMGAAVTLPSGNVLFFGGFTGDLVRAQALAADARYQPLVDVYDVGRSRFYPVTVVNEAEPTAPPGVLRVLFTARLLGTDAQGRARIRVFGGFTSGDEREVPVRFDATLRASAFSVPVLPGVGTSAAPVVDLLYDETTRTATVVPVTASPEPVRTGAAAVSEVVAGRTITAGGISTTGGFNPDREMVRPTIESDWFVWSETELSRRNEIGAMPEAAYRRFGATVTHLDGTEFLVWGGNLTVPPVDMIAPFDEHLGYSGILLDSPTGGGAGTATAVPTAMIGLTAGPVAFHTATRVGAGRVLVTGGLAVISSLVPRMGATAEISAIGLSRTLPGEPPAFTLITNDTTGFRSSSVGGDARSATIFHDITPLQEAGGVPTVLLVTGGARVEASLGLTLYATNEVGTVSGAGDAWAYDSRTTLSTARWGHTTTLLGNGLVLVSGGYQPMPMMPAGELQLTPVTDAEVLLADDLLGVPRPPPVTCNDAGVAPMRDAGRDAPAPTDAPRDAGVPTDAPVDDAPIDPDAPDAP